MGNASCPRGRGSVNEFPRDLKLWYTVFIKKITTMPIGICFHLILWDLDGGSTLCGSCLHVVQVIRDACNIVITGYYPNHFCGIDIHVHCNVTWTLTWWSPDWAVQVQARAQAARAHYMKCPWNVRKHDSCLWAMLCYKDVIYILERDSCLWGMLCYKVVHDLYSRILFQKVYL